MATAVTPTLRTDDIAIAPTASSKNEAGAADRFLKLLVAQMQNQDPLNPMDNAEITSQMAQIQTVSGIEQLNKSIESMVGQFSMLQTMQGAALVGRGVALEGSALVLDEEGLTSGGFDLASPADNVRVEILSGQVPPVVLDSIDLGALGAGRHDFGWALPEGVAPALVAGFRVSARANGGKVDATPLMHDRVASVITGGPTLMLELAGAGNVPYTKIKSFH
jgi:flagellar basal-body rod modification protein FlgD